MKVDYIPFTGGLDSTHSHVITKPGRLTACVNYEEVFGLQGYRRIYGYERFDGRPQPHEVWYSIVNFNTGSVEPVLGAYCYDYWDSDRFFWVASYEVTSGSWAGGDAAGTAIVYGLEKQFTGGEYIRSLSGDLFYVDGPSTKGVSTDVDYDEKLALCTAAARTAIDPVPGTGPILGLAVFENRVYAARDTGDGFTAAIYVSGEFTGWTLVSDKFLAGGKFRFEIVAATGDAGARFLYGCDGINDLFYIDSDSYLYWVKNIWGTCATSATSKTFPLPTLTAQTFTVVEDDKNWVDQELIIRSASDPTLYIVCYATSWDSGTKQLTVMVNSSYGAAGTYDDWDISLDVDYYDGRRFDKPYLLRAHREHLFLAYPRGQLQTSNIGDPTTYTTTASLFGTGSEITDLLTLKSDNLAVYCEDKIFLLRGASQIDWDLTKYSTNSGAKVGTASEIAGAGMHIDTSGAKSLQATQNYGDFGMSTLSESVNDALIAMLPYVVGVQGRKGAQQYRIYASNPDATNPNTKILTFTVLTPSAEILAKDVSPTLQEYPLTITALGSGELGDGEEAHFFGTDDGYVMREHVGPSFDGGALYSSIKLPYNSFKSPSQKKRFRKLIMEIMGNQTLEIFFKQSFDYLDGNYPSSGNMSLDTVASVGLWDESEWDMFTWSNPTQQVQSEINVMGIGRNMSLLIWNTSTELDPFLIQGIIVHYTPLGLQR